MQPLPRWVNLTPQASLVICNIGAWKTDLVELDDSELIKIHVHPFGDVRHTDVEDADVDEQDAA